MNLKIPGLLVEEKNNPEIRCNINFGISSVNSRIKNRKNEKKYRKNNFIFFLQTKYNKIKKDEVHKS